jgi:hypothetical protein
VEILADEPIDRLGLVDSRDLPPCSRSSIETDRRAKSHHLRTLVRPYRMQVVRLEPTPCDIATKADIVAPRPIMGFIVIKADTF